MAVFWLPAGEHRSAIVCLSKSQASCYDRGKDEDKPWWVVWAGVVLSLNIRQGAEAKHSHDQDVTSRGV
jgi:hypothetical protein